MTADEPSAAQSNAAPQEGSSPLGAESGECNPDHSAGTAPSQQAEEPSKAAEGLVIEFDDFLNEPPQYEHLRQVGDYRHEAYRKWIPVRDTIAALQQRVAELEIDCAGHKAGEICQQQRAEKAEAELAALKGKP